MSTDPRIPFDDYETLVSKESLRGDSSACSGVGGGEYVAVESGQGQVSNRIGLTLRWLVVLNARDDGEVWFTPEQARELASVLVKHADWAEHYAAEEAKELRRQTTGRARAAKARRVPGLGGHLVNPSAPPAGESPWEREDKAAEESPAGGARRGATETEMSVYATTSSLPGRTTRIRRAL
jgi:hypothetical protein